MWDKKPFYKKRSDGPQHVSEGMTFDSSDSGGPYKGQVHFKGSIPEKEKVSEAAETWQVKAFRDLQNVDASIDVKADPYQTVLRGDYPYALIARTNRVIDSGYTGYQNIDGNSIVRMFNSDRTQLMNIFDVATLNERLNYLYAAYSISSKNLAVNVELGKAVSEALSKGYSTMLTQLPFYSDGVASSDFPDVDNASGTTVPVLAVGSGVQNKLCLLLHYQSVLQTLVSPESKYIETMSLEQAVMNMCYRREAPIMTSLYGLFKKKAFIATLNAIGTTLIADYFDLSWYKQTNTLTSLCSRRSNSMLDPILTLTATHRIPQCSIYASTSSGFLTDPYYNSDNLKASGIWINPDTLTMDGTSTAPVTLSLEVLVYRLNRMLDISTMLTWARQLNNGSLPANVSIRTPSAYYQTINTLISAIQVLASQFTSAMTEVRTFLDRMQPTNLMYWKSGQWISVDRIQQLDPNYNMILADCFQTYLGGTPSTEWDANTQRWKVNTLWNKYTGIANFDKMSGGSFLTFSLRGLQNVETDSGYRDTMYLIPLLFTDELYSGSRSCLATTRGGIRSAVSTKTITLTSDYNLARLDPLNAGITAKVPNIIEPTGIEATNKAKFASAAIQFLTTTAGYGQVLDNDTSNTVLTSAVDPDYVSFVDVEVEDVSNLMITFCRNYSPFRVATPDGARSIGFGTGSGLPARSRD